MKEKYFRKVLRKRYEREEREERDERLSLEIFEKIRINEDERVSSEAVVIRS